MSQSSSNRLVAMLVVFAIIVAIPAIILSRRPRESSDKVTRLAYMAMKSDLRGLIMAEEATKRIRGRYVPNAEDAGHLSSPGVMTPVIIVSDTGWSATVGYKTIPEIRCAVAVYNRNPIKRFANSGEIVCE